MEVLAAPSPLQLVAYLDRQQLVVQHKHHNQHNPADYSAHQLQNLRQEVYLGPHPQQLLRQPPRRKLAVYLHQQQLPLNLNSNNKILAYLDQIQLLPQQQNQRQEDFLGQQQVLPLNSHNNSLQAALYLVLQL